MNESIFYIKILQSKDEQIEDEALKIFISWICQKIPDQIIFSECGEEEDIFYAFGPENKTMQKIEDFQKTGVSIEFINITTSVLNGKYDDLFLQTFKEGKNRLKLISFLKHKITV